MDQNTDGSIVVVWRKDLQRTPRRRILMAMPFEGEDADYLILNGGASKPGGVWMTRDWR